MAKKLTDKQEKFCNRYIETLDMSDAYRFAFNSSKMKPNTVNRRAFDLYNQGKIRARINELKAERSERTKIDSDYVLVRLTEIDQMDALDILESNGDIKPIKDWPKVWRTSLSGMDVASIISGDTETVLKKIKWPDKTKNLELIGRHVDVQAWKDKVEHTGKIDLTSKSDDELKRIIDDKS